MSNRFYGEDGKPQYQAGLKEARKEGFLISHTSVLDVIYNYGLEKWKQDQFILIAKDNLMLPNETDKDYIKRIRDISYDKKKDAPDYGKVIHNLIERYLKNECIQMVEYDMKIQTTMPEVWTWIDENIEKPILIEPQLTNLEYGFAGKPDLLCELKTGEIALIDWKTAKTTKNWKVTGWPSWCWQIAAQERLVYSSADIELAHILGEQGVGRYMNIAISNTEPGRVDVVEWSQEDIDKGWEIFESALKIWQIKNRF